MEFCNLFKIKKQCWRHLIILALCRLIVHYLSLAINMNFALALHDTADISAIRQNYDTNNPVIAEIIKAKEDRLRILQEFNKQHQEEFDNKDIFLKKNLKKKEKSLVHKANRKSVPNISILPVRRSVRLQNSPSVTYREIELCKSEPAKNKIIRPPNDYGAVPGVEVGTHWNTRMECSLDGVHRPTVAGIHGGPDGAYSIALSGGYPEDIDEGDSFIYTGSGGRDLKGTSTKPKNLRTAPQTKDQQLEGTNLSLVRNIESKLPVRVIRGYKSPSIFAPETGYRYDGLYQVVQYWEDTGKTGHRIYRFRMERIKDQAPPPWERKNKSKGTNGNFDDEFPFINNEDLEFKENVVPDNEASILCCKKNSIKDVKDLENEIQLCIDFFLKAAAIKCNDVLERENSEEEFRGWD